MDKKSKHLFFDMDGTLTRSRTPITAEMKEVLNSLAEDHTLMVTSGQSSEAIMTQLDGANITFVLGQNGNHAFQNGEEMWANALSKEAIKEVMEHIAHFESVRDWDVKNANDLIENRGNYQVSYSCLGHHEHVPTKMKFDPGGHKRTKMLEGNPVELKLADVKVAGTTTFDYFVKDSNKGTNILKLIEQEGWNKEDCIYFGDALFPGGNDEAVLGVVDVQKVEDENDTLAILKERYANS